jgi:hypothetical protein
MGLSWVKPAGAITIPTSILTVDEPDLAELKAGVPCSVDRESRTETKELRTGTVRTRTEEIQFCYGSLF